MTDTTSGLHPSISRALASLEATGRALVLFEASRRASSSLLNVRLVFVVDMKPRERIALLCVAQVTKAFFVLGYAYIAVKWITLFAVQGLYV